METLRDMCQRHRDAGTDCRGGSCLPSLSSSGGRSLPLDSAPSPAPPPGRHGLPEYRQRRRSELVPSTSSMARPVELSRSAPGAMETQLSSSTVARARVHIQTRLSSTPEGKMGPSSAPPRTPKLLAPLEVKQRVGAVCPALDRRVPLKPIGPGQRGLAAGRGGSEESSSSSCSQSSVNLEGEKDQTDLREDLGFAFETLLKPSAVDSRSIAEDGFRVQGFQGQSRGSLVPAIQRRTEALDRHDLKLKDTPNMSCEDIRNKVDPDTSWGDTPGLPEEHSEPRPTAAVKSHPACDQASFSHLNLPEYQDGGETVTPSRAICKQQGAVTDCALNFDNPERDPRRRLLTGHAEEKAGIGPEMLKTSRAAHQGSGMAPHGVSGNRAQRHPILQDEGPVSTDTACSKSTVELISYKDMFKPISIEGQGPAIFEMFAGPVFDGLRVSSSCGVRRVLPPACRRMPQTSRRRPIKQAPGKQRRSPAESGGKAKPVSARAKPRKKGMLQKRNLPKAEAEPAVNHDQPECLNGSREMADGPALPGLEPVRPDGISGTTGPDVNVKELATGGQILKKQVPSPPSPKSLQRTETWTSSGGRSSATALPPVYRRLLDEVGDGPLTDDLLHCLAEELIYLDERDASQILEVSAEDSGRVGRPAAGGDENPEVKMNGSAELDSSTSADAITWKKGEVLGRGAYGTVYCGLTSQGRLIAVKQVSLDSSDPDSAWQDYGRLQGEVQLLQTLRHTNIVGFLGTSLCRHVISIFMEYVPGGSIASVLHRFGPLPERVLALYTRQILEGVAYLHRNGVVHRDLKGNNIMLMPNGVVKLIDFGCARRLNHAASSSKDLLHSVHGTPYWMAPEVISETGYGRKSDIWSLGCTAFEMATGKPPLAHMDKMAALFYIGAKRGLMPPLPDGFSASAKDFVSICLTNDPGRRPSAEKLLQHPFVHCRPDGIRPGRTRSCSCCKRVGGACDQEAPD